MDENIVGAIPKIVYFDSVGQELEIGDLVIFQYGNRTRRMKFGRVVCISSNRVRIAFAYQKYDENGMFKPSYKITGSVDIYNCVSIERENIQPEIKELLNKWNNSRKRKQLHDALDMPEETINRWTKERCKSL